MSIPKKVMSMIAKNKLAPFKSTVEQALEDGHDINEYLEIKPGFNLLHVVVWNPASTIDFKKDAIAFLKDKGADFSIKTTKGQTCRDLTTHPKIAELFPAGQPAHSLEEYAHMQQKNMSKAAEAAPAASQAKEAKTPLMEAIAKYQASLASNDEKDQALGEIITLMESGTDITGALAAAYNTSVITDIIEDATSQWVLDIKGDGFVEPLGAVEDA
jgi:hypothetical protein